MNANPPLLRRSKPTPATGIVHLGLGAFFRAHGALYVEDAQRRSGGDWGIAGVSLRNPDQRDRLAPQDWVYSAISLTRDGPERRVVDMLSEVLFAEEQGARVLELMVSPATRIVSLTVTDKGYCHVPATGRLNADHPDILHDMQNMQPVSAPGYLVRALQQRKARGLRPFTVMCCDNLPRNGELVRALVLQLAAEIDPGLADWIAQEARFPNSMVDRIVPATKPEDIEEATAIWEVRDASLVFHEPFGQWAIADDFVDEVRPDLAAAGVELVDDVHAYEQMKLRCLNGSHSALAYLGYLAGHRTISDTVADSTFTAYLRDLWQEEIIPTVKPPQGVDLVAYTNDLLDRFSNQAIRNLNWQIAMDGSQKLPQRLLGTARDLLESGRRVDRIATAIAAWMIYVSGRDLQGNPVDVRDPLATELSAKANSADPVNALLAMRTVFDEQLGTETRFVEALKAAHSTLKVRGCLAAIQSGSMA